MINPYNKLRLRRRLRRTQKDVELAQEQAASHFKRHIARRWQNLRDVRRFVLGWVGLVLILVVGVLLQQRQLTAYYQEPIPVEGGTFVEGMVGEVTNLNPIFATSPVDAATSKLIFNGLLRYDENNQLVGDLAETWSVNDDGTIYTVVLRPNIYWHDSKPVTAQDVVFTFQTVQHPDARSPFNSNWRDVTIQAVDERTVTFELPNSFTPFAYSLTTGILPSHVFEGISPLEMRAHGFNLTPAVGTGPFRFDQIVSQDGLTQVQLQQNEQYHRGAPKLKQFIVRTFSDHEKMIQAFQNDELTSMADLSVTDKASLGAIEGVRYHTMPVYNIVFSFYNMSDPIMSNKDVRTAMTQATNRDELFEVLEKNFPQAHGPLLVGQVGFDDERLQHDYDPVAASQKLDAAGWVMGPDGVRTNGSQRLSLHMVTQNSDEYPLVAATLQKQLAAIGVELNVSLVSANDLQQNHVIPHNYQILLLGIAIGIDPDVFVYWHSSQAEVQGFNLSEYKSPTVDAALEAGRTRIDPSLRAAKYKAFLDKWIDDVPATALYRPVFTYAQDEKVSGFTNHSIVNPEDRFGDVHEWALTTKKVDKKL